MVPAVLARCAIAIAGAGFLFAATPAVAHAEGSETVTLTVRGKAKQRFLLLRPDGPPEAAVLLYPGGSGKIGIRSDGTIKTDGNFLVRSRDLFVRQGFLVAVVDRPTDWAGSDKATYRLSAAHAEDAAAIIGAIRERAKVPAWLVGTSRGTVSVANIAARLGRDRIAGIVLTSAVTEPSNNYPQTVPDADLSAIAVPVLILGHKGDDCHVTPWSGQTALKPKLRHATVVETDAVEGGNPGNMGAPCEAWSHHGFLGQEEAVVGRIAAWIKRRRQ